MEKLNIFYFLHFAMDRLTLFLGKFLAWAYRNQDCMVLSPARTGKDPPYKVKYLSLHETVAGRPFRMRTEGLGMVQMKKDSTN